MTNLVATFQDRFSDWLTALSQHLQLSLFLTLLLAIFIAIPLAVYLRYHEVGLGLTDCRDFSDYPVTGPVGTLYPLDGVEPSYSTALVITIFSILQKYHYWAQRN